MSSEPTAESVLRAYEAWEADLLMSDEAWAGGMRDLPSLTQSLWDRLMEIQSMRNLALAAAPTQASEDGSQGT